MQRAPTAVEIDGHVVHIGSTVQVNWLGVWYEGTVIKVGPKRNLCRVRDVSSNETVLLESRHLKSTVSRVMDTHMSAGTHVVYKSGDHWQEGVVDSNSAEGVIMVSWRKSGLSEENLTWFEFSHIAPVIHNELYEEHNRELLEAGKSGLLQNNALEPRPRTMDNMLYESGSDLEEDPLNEPAASRSSPTRSRKKQPEVSPQQEVVHHLTESTEEGKKRAGPAPFPPPPSPPFPFLPIPMYMPLPPMMSSPVHPYGSTYLPVEQNQYVKMSPSFMSANNFHSSLPHPSSMPHPSSLKKPGLSHTSVPCILSYTKSTNGIPPHPSSKFFKSLRNAKLRKKKLSNPSQPHAKSRVKKSPTVESEAHSEPHYATIPVQQPRSTPTKKIPISSKKSVPTAIEQTPPSEQSPHKPSYLPHLHPTNPSSNTSSSPLSRLPLPHLQSPVNKNTKQKSKPGKEHTQTAPPPLPPRTHKSAPPKSATAASRQPPPTSAREPLGRGENHPCVPAHVTKEPEQWEEDEMWEEVEMKVTDNECPERQSQDQGGRLEVVSVSPAHVTVAHGSSTLLTCVARSSRTVHYEWFKDGKPLSEHDPFFTQPAPGMLQIQMASMYLTGEYKCVVSDNHSSMERVFHLKVCTDIQDSDKQGAIPAEKSWSQFTNKVTPEELNMEIPTGEATPEAQTSSSHPHNLSSHRKLPLIAVEKSQSEPTSPSLLHSPRSMPSSSGRDTHDVSCSDTKVNRGRDDEDAGEKKVTEGRKSIKRNRHRVSSALKNDIELYLKGYGENYGEQSSKTNLELEMWWMDLSDEERMEEQSKRKGKRKKKKKKTKSSSESSSPAKSSGKHESSKKSKNAKLPPTVLGKKQVGADKASPRPTDARQRTQAKVKITKNPPRELEKEEANSVAVHTSVGVSSGSEVSLDGCEMEEGASGRLELPQEQESLNDSVRRLQLSVEEYCPEQLQFAEKDKKRASILQPKNKLS